MFRLSLWTSTLNLAFLGFLTSCALAPKAAGVVSDMGTQVSNLVSSASSVPTQEYVVQPGDTPSGVALKYGTTIQVLVDLNANTHPEMGQTPMKFNAGWRILVPAQRVNSQASGGSGTQVIQSSATEVFVSGPVPTGGQLLDASGGQFDEAGALEIIQLTNAERARVGLGPLSINDPLMQIARKRATEIVTDWGHQGLDDDCAECGENLTKFGTVAQEFASWMQSDGHRGNILAAAYTQVGVGRYLLDGKSYASELFK